MGEYARKTNGQEIKIGTCEDMFYLRLEDVGYMHPIPGNVNAAVEMGLRFRLPFPDEDDRGPGNYDQYNRGLRLFRVNRNEHTGRDEVEDYNPDWLGEVAAGGIQLHHKESGLLVNVDCHHGRKLPDVGPRASAHWNGKGHSLELSSIKRSHEGIVPVVRCRHCGSMWSGIAWSEVLPFIHDEEMRRRLERYAAATV